MGTNTVQFFGNKDIFIREIAVRLAGKKAEELVFGRKTSQKAENLT
jgi:ATP-dependent Zn protease